MVTSARAEASSIEAPAVTLAVAAFAAMTFLPHRLHPAGAVVFATMAVLGARRGSAPIAHVGLALALVSAAMPLVDLVGLWAVPLLLGLGAYWAIARRMATWPEARAWFPRGTFGRRTVAIAVGFVALSSVALLGWFMLLKPDLSDLRRMLPAGVPWVVLVLAGFAFALANAFAEEFLYRGVLFGALDGVLSSRTAAVAIQSVAFGVAHYPGFPRGWTGVALATVYGAMMGIVRVTSGGLLPPIAAHIAADVTIFSIVALLAR